MNPSMSASRSREMHLQSDTNYYTHQYLRLGTPAYEEDGITHDPARVYYPKPLDNFLAEYPPGISKASAEYGPLPGEPGYETSPFRTLEASPPVPNTVGPITARHSPRISKPTRPGKSSRVKGGRVQKSTKDSKYRKSTSILTKPLSELAKDVPHIPVADIPTFVARTAEERRLETSRNKKSGQIKRPMNAFMLYRKAYQEVAKTQCTQKNHQLVSKVCGASWPMESDEIHNSFNEWAKIERDSHQKAHPGYKFTPSKPRKGKQTGETDIESPAGSEIEDPTWAAPRPPRRTPQRNTAHANQRSVTPSFGYEIPPEKMEAQHMGEFQDVYLDVTPNRTQPVMHQQVEFIPAYADFLPPPQALDIMQQATTRHSSPGSVPGYQPQSFTDPSLHGLDYDGLYGLPTNYGGERFTSELLMLNYSNEEFLNDINWGHAQLSSDNGQGVKAKLPPPYRTEGELNHDKYLAGKFDDWSTSELQGTPLGTEANLFEQMDETSRLRNQMESSEQGQYP